MWFDKWRQYGRRLTDMGLGEIADRSRQALLKRCDSAMGFLGCDLTPELRKCGGPSPRFFFDGDSIDTILQLMQEKIPAQARQIIDRADQVLRHEFDLLGYRGLDYGLGDGQIRWHYDAVNKKTAPKKAFHKIRYLDYDECGDSKVIWELNRHQHFMTLAKAYRLTGNCRYLDEIRRQRSHWERENPYPIGINWASSLEVAIRSLSWLWTYHLLAGSKDFPDSREMWLRRLALHGRHIERYLSTYFSPNTHLLGEGVGLFSIGVLCPELDGAKRWKSLGWATILQESERQIRPDGFHFEQSTYYHVYALDFLIHAAVLAGRNDIPVPKRFEKKIEKMMDALAMMGRFGPPPRFGDDDGGRLFDPARNREEHLLDPLSNGALLFRRGDLKTLVGTLREESLWLFGKSGVEAWDRLEPASVADHAGALQDAGMYFLTGKNSQMIVDAGPMGRGNGGHGHADALSVCLQAEGMTLLIDPGTLAYVRRGGERDWFRGTAIHNSLNVDGKDQADPATTFSWKRLTQTAVERWVNGRSFDLLVAAHDGFRRLPQPIIHRRWFLSLKNGIYLVRDVMDGSGIHDVEITWNLAPELELEGEWRFRAKGADSGLQIVPTRLAGWTGHVGTGAWSGAYGHKVCSRVLKFRAQVNLPAEFSVVLVVIRDFVTGEGLQSQLDIGRSAGLSSYAYTSGNSEYSFAFSGVRDDWSIGNISSNAEFVCCRKSPRASDDALILSGGSYATIKGGRELRYANKVVWGELLANDRSQLKTSHDQGESFGSNRVPTFLPEFHAGS